MSNRFNLAQMSPTISFLTYALWLLPVSFGVIGLWMHSLITIAIAVILFGLYGVVWFWCRPSHFILNSNYFAIEFPAWRETIPLDDIYSVHITDRIHFEQEFGWSIRIGVGGLWGVFGWLLTQRQGLIEIYVSRFDRSIVISRRTGKPLVVSPSSPSLFVQSLDNKIAEKKSA